MKPSEMADALKDYAQLSNCTTGQALVLNRAADELNHRAEWSSKPLTLEKLKQMDGEPVWVKRLSEKQDLSCWGFHDEDGVCGYCANFDDDDYGKTWLAYDHKPEGSENK